MRDPYFAKTFKKSDIIIPTTVLEELDNHKGDKGENGRNVREFGRLFVADMFSDDLIYETFDSSEFEGTNDLKIIRTAKENDAIVLTGDYLMAAIATSMNVQVQMFKPENMESDESFSGFQIFESGEAINELDLYANEYVLPKGGRLQKYDGSKMVNLCKDNKVFGIRHKNVEQKCALDALLDDNIKLVTLSGRAGTGKTLLAIAAGLEKTITTNKFQKLLVSRPIVAMGDDVGYLPGDLNEKLSPWMQPIFDNIDFLFDIDGEGKAESWKDLEAEGLLKLEALTYIRGRSIPNQFMIIDEAQNLTPHEVKTIITRVGEGTKIILTGDPDQIDNRKCDSVDNGLSYVIEKFKDYKIAAHITLTKGERSELADIASDIL